MGGTSPNVWIPEKDVPLPRWVERELRTGGQLDRYLVKERAQTKRRLEKACLTEKTYERRPGSEFDLMAVVDSRTWMRWHLTDPHFWEDKKNVKRFVKDNPICAPWRT